MLQVLSYAERVSQLDGCEGPATTATLRQAAMRLSHWGVGQTSQLMVAYVCNPYSCYTVTVCMLPAEYSLAQRPVPRPKPAFSAAAVSAQFVTHPHHRHRGRVAATNVLHHAKFPGTLPMLGAVGPRVSCWLIASPGSRGALPQVAVLLCCQPTVVVV